MKIRTKEKSYEEAMALPREKHENPMRQSGIIRKLLKAISYFDLKAVHATEHRMKTVPMTVQPVPAHAAGRK